MIVFVAFVLALAFVLAGPAGVLAVIWWLALLFVLAVVALALPADRCRHRRGRRNRQEVGHRMRRTPYRVNAIEIAADGKSYLCVSIDVCEPPPGPGWQELWTPNREAKGKRTGRQRDER
jgi:hypothetical protein